MAYHNALIRGAGIRPWIGAAVAALAMCSAIPRNADAQFGSLTPVFEFPPPAPFGNIPGVTISWQPGACTTTSSIVVHVGSRTYATTWTLASVTGLGTATYNLSGDRFSVVSTDQTHKLNNPVLTMSCILIQYTVPPATISWAVYGENVTSNTGTESAVAPPKPKLMLEYGTTSGTALDISLPQGEAAAVDIDGSSSAPGDVGGPAITTYAWLKGGASAGSAASFETTFPSTMTVSLTVTDAIGGSASQSGSVTITPVYPCDDPLTEEVEDCNSNQPGGGEQVSYDGGSSEPGSYAGGSDTSTYVCYVTDWYQWNGSAWAYTDTTLDYCTFE